MTKRAMYSEAAPDKTATETRVDVSSYSTIWESMLLSCPEKSLFPNGQELQHARKWVRHHRERGPGSQRRRAWQEVISFASFLGLIAILPDSGWASFLLIPIILFVTWIGAVSRHDQTRRGLREYLAVELRIPICIDCGYDLRNLSETRCPECGKKDKRTFTRKLEGTDKKLPRLSLSKREAARIANGISVFAIAGMISAAIGTILLLAHGIGSLSGLMSGTLGAVLAMVTLVTILFCGMNLSRATTALLPTVEDDWFVVLAGFCLVAACFQIGTMLVMIQLVLTEEQTAGLLRIYRTTSACSTLTTFCLVPIPMVFLAGTVAKRLTGRMVAATTCCLGVLVLFLAGIASWIWLVSGDAVRSMKPMEMEIVPYLIFLLVVGPTMLYLRKTIREASKSKP